MAVKKTGTTDKATSAAKKPRRTAPAKVKSTIAEAAAPVAPKMIRPAKPIFAAGTWLAVVLLIALVGLTFYLKNQKEKAGIADATPVSGTTPLFNAEDGIITGIEIMPAAGGNVKVARNAENAWAMELPFKTEANQGMVEAAATQITTLQVLSPIDADPEIFGLKTPAFVIKIDFKGGKTHTLEIGDATPTKSGYYVRIDKDKMMITDLSGIDSLLQLATFPPYLNTPTPTSVPSTLVPVSPTQEISTPVP